MIPVNGITATGALLLLVCVLLVPACSLISRERDRRVVFPGPVTVPRPGMCGCGAPKCTPEPAPFPGDVPFLAAPVDEPAAPETDGDTAWNRGHVEDVWALLRAEAVSSDG